MRTVVATLTLLAALVFAGPVSGAQHHHHHMCRRHHHACKHSKPRPQIHIGVPYGPVAVQPSLGAKPASSPERSSVTVTVGPEGEEAPLTMVECLEVAAEVGDEPESCREPTDAEVAEWVALEETINGES